MILLKFKIYFYTSNLITKSFFLYATDYFFNILKIVILKIVISKLVILKIVILKIVILKLVKLKLVILKVVNFCSLISLELPYKRN